MRVTLRDGLELEVATRGSGPPAVLVHGFTGSNDAWPEPVLEALARHARVITLDLIGHGASARPLEPDRYAMVAVVRDVCEVLDATGVRRATWIGYSMGGRIALGAAVLAPDRVAALVLEGASPGLSDERERLGRVAADEALATDLERDGIAAFVDRWAALPLFASQARLPEATREAARRRRLANDPAALAACLRGLGTGSQPDFWGALEGVGAPALLLAGELDAKFRTIATEMAHHLPNARVECVERAGHATHLEEPERYAKLVTAFLRERGGVADSERTET